MRSEKTYELDLVLVRVLASVHPLDFSQLRLQLLAILVGTTGIDPTHVACAPLSLARSIDDLARVEWEQLLAEVAPHSCLPRRSLVAIFAHLRLFAERAVLHTCLFRSRSASTLWSLDTWSIPRRGWPGELTARYGEFGEACWKADEALQKGRASLQACERALLKERTLDRPQAFLLRANACYARYLQALQQADHLADSISWYLTETQDKASTPDGDIQREERRVA